MTAMTAMSAKKRIGLYIIKLAGLFGLFVGLVFGWIIFCLYTYEIFSYGMMLAITLAAVAAYFALAVKVSRLGIESKAERAGMSMAQKLRRPLGLIIPLIIMNVIFLFEFHNIF